MSKKIIFMGTPIFAVPILKSLYQNGFPVSVVYTQPPQRSHRGQKFNKSPIQNIAETFNIEIRTPEKLKGNKDEFNYLKKLDADLAIVVAYGQIIPKEFLELTKKGFINIHGSILPKWRGAAPIQRSVMNLDKETGISIMKMKEKLDTGPIFSVYKIKIDQNDNSQDISKKLSHLASEKILDYLDKILEGEVRFIEQDHTKATYAKKIQKQEGLIDWNNSAEKILGQINGLFPFPGAFFLYKGERYKITKSKIGSGRGKAGEVLSDQLEIACGNNLSIKVIEIQRQGKKIQKVGEFMLGSQIKKGLLI